MPAASSPSITAIRVPGCTRIQLEINRAIYMDEKRYERSADFERVAADLETLADRVAEIPAEELRPYRSAAE